MRKLTKEEFIQKAVAVHGDKYDYINVKYENNRKKVEIICPKHGSFEQTPSDHLMRRGCPECGKEKLSEVNTNHGQSNSKEYRIWSHMKTRCYNLNSQYYHRYGGRGISVCDRWLNSFENFYADMGECPEGYSIDRIDNDKGYCPENCRWATRTEQQNNKSDNVVLTIYGKTMSLNDWCRDTGQNYMTVYGRLKRGWTPEEAIFGREK
jgi:predicted  nucleic acid-binding Zn-ribbon protein